PAPARGGRHHIADRAEHETCRGDRRRAAHHGQRAHRLLGGAGPVPQRGGASSRTVFDGMTRYEFVTLGVARSAAALSKPTCTGRVARQKSKSPLWPQVPPRSPARAQRVAVTMAKNHQGLLAAASHLGPKNSLICSNSTP